MEKEGVSFAKLAVSLIFLLIAIAFYASLQLMADSKGNELMERTSSTMDSALMEKVLTLDNQSRKEEYPLVSSIASALYELSGKDVLYIRILLPDGSDTCYTLDGVNLSGVGSAAVQYTDDMCETAAKSIVTYSSYRGSLILDYYDGMPYLVISHLREV